MLYGFVEMKNWYCLFAVMEFDAFQDFVEPFVFAAVAAEFFIVWRMQVRASGGQQLVLHAIFTVERRNFLRYTGLRTFDAVKLE